MKKLKDFVRQAKYVIALENEGFESVEAYRNELYIYVEYRFYLIKDILK